MVSTGPPGAPFRLPAVIALGGATCIASSAILMKLARSSAVADALFRCGFALPVLGPLAHRERRRGAAVLGRRARSVARLAGVMLAANLVLWQHSIVAVGAGMATVLGNIQVVVAAGLSWAFLGERPCRRFLLAPPVMLLGLVMTAGLLGSHPAGDDPGLGMLYGSTTALLYSGSILLLRQTTSAHSEPDPHLTAATIPVVQPLYEATLTATATSAVMVLALPGFRIGPLWPALGWLALLALCAQVLGWLFIAKSMPRLPAARLSVLLLVQPVGAVLLAATVLGQYPSASQLAGVAMMLAGMVVAASSSSVVGRRYGRGARQRLRAAPSASTGGP